jgi:hypothetical protein
LKSARARIPFWFVWLGQDQLDGQLALTDSKNPCAEGKGNG